MRRCGPIDRTRRTTTAPRSGDSVQLAEPTKGGKMILAQEPARRAAAAGARCAWPGPHRPVHRPPRPHLGPHHMRGRPHVSDHATTDISDGKHPPPEGGHRGGRRVALQGMRLQPRTEVPASDIESDRKWRSSSSKFRSRKGATTKCRPQNGSPVSEHEDDCERVFATQKAIAVTRRRD
jgi:hypothetical protein